MKPVSGKRMCRILEGNGWVLSRIKGSHHAYQRPGQPGTIIVPVHGHDDLKPGTQHAIMRDAGLTEADLQAQTGRMLVTDFRPRPTGPGRATRSE